MNQSVNGALMMKRPFLLLLLLCICSITYADEHTDIHIETLIKSDVSWDGASLPHYQNGEPEITVLKVVIPPGKAIGMHKHPMINSGVLLSGAVTVTSKTGATTVINAGEAVIELVDQWHKGINAGTEPVVMLVFYAGVKGQPLSIQE